MRPLELCAWVLLGHKVCVLGYVLCLLVSLGFAEVPAVPSKNCLSV
jgi:hypothetical protein